MKARRLAAFLAIALAAQPDFRFREVVPGYRFEFPRDHFDHPDYRTEWWYYTGNVETSVGGRYGFELVFFRQGQRRSPNPSNESVWRIDDLYLAHAAVTDIGEKRFRYEERLNRAGPDIAGVNFDTRHIWNGNWSVQFAGDYQTLNVVAEDFQFSLKLLAVKPAILNGVNGVSQKAEGRGKASYYVSFPRLSVMGTIGMERAVYVRGTAWMDHEWFTHQLDTGQTGWDWFSIQLENHTELMLYQLRRKDGSIDPYSSGTYVDAAGKAHHLTVRDFRLTPLEKWTRYPIHWRIEVPSLKMQLDCRAVMDNQELKATKGGTTYWEGAVDYSGSTRGVGYLEMTGYDKAVEF